MATLLSNRVNALKRASLISTQTSRTYLENSRLCQCPKTGFPHFYSQRFECNANNRMECQCPKTGFPHFYPTDANAATSKKQPCQCPKTGFPHFYRLRAIVELHSNGCVNALKRASLISTITLPTSRKDS